jgi:hypothetical protein
MVQYESKDDAGHKFWTARYGRYAVRIDAIKPGLYRWVITLDGPAVRKGTAPNRDEAAAACKRHWRSCPDRRLDLWVMSHLSTVPLGPHPPRNQPV